jgi:hypothetical protein
MRVARERLIFIALAVLMRARHDLQNGAIKPGAEVRLALAVLFAFSRSGERAHYDRFWRNLSDPFAGAERETQSSIFRQNEAHACFEWITRDVGAPGDAEYRSKVGELLSGPPKHPWRRGER